MTENIIVRETPSELRRLARAVLRGNWKKLFAGFVIYSIFAVFIPNILTEMVDSFSTSVYIEELGMNYSFPTFLHVYRLVLTGVLQFGLYAFVLRFLRTREVRYDRLFSGFEHLFPVFLLSFLVSLMVGLWSMLLIVPGLIAWLRYYMAMYILHDDPQIGVFGAIRASKVMTYGNKSLIFVTLLSFIGWRILAYLPAGILDGFYAAGLLSNLSTTVLVTLEYLLLLPSYFVAVYAETTMALLYEIMSGRLRKTAPAMSAPMPGNNMGF